MSDEIIGLHRWFDSPPGRYLLAWEQQQYDELVADIFGYHAVQLGMSGLQGLRANRMPHRWLALGLEESRLPPEPGAPVPAPDLLAYPVALPFDAASIDLVLLPHALELSVDPHAALREVERVLVPEGRVVISGLSPWSLWGLRQRRARLYQRFHAGGELYLPDVGEFIAPGRMRDWLRLLNFEVDSLSFGCYRPAVGQTRWLDRFDWMDGLGARWWPILGAAYTVVAVKRVHGMRLMAPPWRASLQPAAATVPVAQRRRR